MVQLHAKCGEHQIPSSQPSIGLATIAPVITVSQYEKNNVSVFPPL
jgi:hypothetical protein